MLISGLFFFRTVNIAKTFKSVHSN